MPQPVSGSLLDVVVLAVGSGEHFLELTELHEHYWAGWQRDGRDLGTVHHAVGFQHVLRI